MTARATAITAIANHRVASTQNYQEDGGADIYGDYVFHEGVQRQYLAKPIFQRLRRTIDGHEPFDPAIADAVAHAVKEWAMAQGLKTLKVKVGITPESDIARVKAVRDAFEIVRHGGHVVLFGIPSRPVEIDIAESLVFKNLTVQAVNGREIWQTWYTTRWLLEHGVVDLRPLITCQLPLERFDEAFAALESGEACKIVLRTEES